jgi:hypothetical protein
MATVARDSEVDVTVTIVALIGYNIGVIAGWYLRKMNT